MGQLVFNKKNIPNFLTIIRILLVPIIVIFLSINININIYHFEILANDPKWSLTTNVNLNYLLAAILFVIVCLTDFLDGYLARKYNWITNFGKILDPIADKILVISVLITLSIELIIPWYLIIIIISRDLFVDGVRGFLATKNIVVPANFLGKLKTVFQMIAIIIVLFIFNDNKFNFGYFFIQNLVLIIATILTIISGIYYLIASFNKIKNL